MNKLGVIQVIDSLDAGGAEVLAMNIANALSEEGFNSHLCTTRKEGVLKNNLNKKTTFLFLERKKSIDFSAIIKFKKYLKNNNIGVIHAHSTSSFFVFCVKLIYPKVKIIWHDHYGKSQELKKRKTFLLKIITFFFQSIISVNGDLKKWAEDELNCKKVFFLNNFPVLNNVEKTTVLHGEKNKRIVHLAGFREQKDHENLINAFKILLDRHKGWTLHLIGKQFKTDYTEKVKNLIKSKNIEKTVFLYDVCLDISNILSQATIGVLSSRSEGLPVSLLEYGLAELPVVVTNVGECNKVVKNGESGIVVEKENSLELAEALEEYIISEEKRNRYGELHAKNVRENYSQATFIHQLVKIYTL